MPIERQIIIGFGVILMEGKGVFSSLKNSYNSYKDAKLDKAQQRAELEEEYRTGRDCIIREIKECIKNETYEDAQILIDTYADVAKGDVAIDALKNEIRSKTSPQSQTIGGTSGEGKGVFSSLKNSYNSYKGAKLEKAHQREVLEEEYRNDRDYIIQGIKDSIKNEQYQEALLLVDKYADVAGDDAAFDVLKNEVRSKALSQSRTNTELERLTTQLDIVPESDYNQKYPLYQKLSRIDPENAKWQDGIIECEMALGKRAKVASDLRLGSVVLRKSLDLFRAAS